jgi:hypothetical protein
MAWDTLPVSGWEMASVWVVVERDRVQHGLAVEKSSSERYGGWRP